jgi:hypothetical protein
MDFVIYNGAGKGNKNSPTGNLVRYPVGQGVRAG